MNRTPTPTECTLLLFMYNQCLFHEHVIFTHVHQRLPNVHPLWYVIAFIQFGVNGRDESAPTPTECMLRIVHEHVIFTHVHQHLSTCTHCREPIYRARISRNTRCGYFCVSLILFFICAIVSVHSWYSFLEVWQRLTSPPHWIKID